MRLRKDSVEGGVSWLRLVYVFDEGYGADRAPLWTATTPSKCGVSGCEGLPK